METQSTELLPTLYAGAITLIGGLFVIMYAASRFNTPVTNRSITTWMRYHRAASMCLGVGLVLFALLAAYQPFQTAVKHILPTLAGDEVAGLRLILATAFLTPLCDGSRVSAFGDRHQRQGGSP